MDHKTQYIFATVKQIEEDTREIEAVASTPDLDRDGDILKPTAFKKTIGSFKSNPVILATHQHRLADGKSPVIGSAIPEAVRITDQELAFRMRFAGTALGEEYWQLYRDKHMRAFSVGFIPLKWEDDTDQSTRYRTVRTYTEAELLEISAVPVPSNRRALARAKGFYDADQAADDIRQAVEAAMDQQLTRLKDWLAEELDEIKSLNITDPAGLAEAFVRGTLPESSGGSGDDDKTARTLELLNEIKQSQQGG